MTSTIILATQRSGSTLLCSELEGIGGLGRPGEHVLAWLEENPDADAMPSATLAALLSAGRDATGAVGLKLMADYAPRLAALLGHGGAEEAAAVAAMLRGFETRFGPTAVFRIRREGIFDQALSSYLAVSTGIFVRTEQGPASRGVEADADRHEAALAGFDIARLEEQLARIADEEARLDRVCAALDRPVLTVDYDALVATREAVLAACCAHAGRPVPEAWPVRAMRKVVDPALRDRFRAAAEAIWADRAAAGMTVPSIARAARARR